MDIIELASQNKISRVFLARNKLNFAGAISHITQHSCGKEPLFVEENDYLYFLSLMKERAKKFEVDIFVFCLMPNHLHILLRTNRANSPQVMHSLFRTYAAHFNKKYGRKGHVFCGSFRQSLCLDDSYALAASAYIHLNPYKAGLVDDYKLYRWSSQSLYVENIDKETFVNFKYILQLLSPDLNKARSTYRNLLKSMLEVKVNLLREGKFALGAFRAKMLRSLRVLAGENGRDVLSRGMLEDREIEAKVEDLRTKKRLRAPVDIQARKFLVEQLKAQGYRISEIAGALNLTRQTINKISSNKTEIEAEIEEIK